MDIPKNFYRVSIKAIINDSEGRVLFAQEKSGVWELPGGGLEYGEKPEEGLRREVNEELGVEVIDIEERPSYIWSVEREKSYKYFCFFVGYKIKVNSLDFVKSDECQDLKFFSKEDMRSIKRHPNIEPFFEHLK